MPDRFSTDLRHRNYHSRGLVRHHFVDNPCRVSADGTLLAFVQRTYRDGQLLYSEDGGFSWQPIFNSLSPPSDDLWYHVSPRSIAGLDVQGPIVFLELVPDLKGAFLFTGGDIPGGPYIHKFQYINLFTGVAQINSFEVIGSGDALEGVFAVSAYQERACVVYVGSATQYLYADSFSLYEGSLSGAIRDTSHVYENRFAAVANGKTGVCDIAIQTSNGTPAIRHVKYTFGALTLSAPVTILSGTTAASIAIARDGYNSVCAAWSEVSGATITIKYAISRNGAAWQNRTPTMGGTSTYIDAVTSQPAGRIDIIGGEDGGFMLMYVRLNDAGVPRLYVQRITTPAGTVYTAETAVEATSRPVTDKIVGGHFFKPEEDKLPMLGLPGFVRIAYQVNEGNSALGLDTIPVRFCQELLTTAYPVATGTANTSTNKDFYAAGMVGAHTTKYLNAFTTLGTSYLVRKYQPFAAAKMAERSAYGAPTEVTQTCMLDPSSYGFPIPSISAEEQAGWIERDVRRVYFPPNFPLLRNFVLNAGGFMKRTVWTIGFDGNEYEISQVVPRFLDDQIILYEANAYVIGPSRDPFSRIVLPSET